MTSIPAAWRDRLVGAWIGDYDHWGSGDIRSDHAPVAIDLTADADDVAYHHREPGR
jgi:hypothetical protein